LYRNGMTHNKRDIIRDYIRLPKNDDLLLRRAKP